MSDEERAGNAGGGVTGAAPETLKRAHATDATAKRKASQRAKRELEDSRLQVVLAHMTAGTWTSGVAVRLAEQWEVPRSRVAEVAQMASTLVRWSLGDTERLRHSVLELLEVGAKSALARGRYGEMAQCLRVLSGVVGWEDQRPPWRTLPEAVSYYQGLADQARARLQEQEIVPELPESSIDREGGTR